MLAHVRDLNPLPFINQPWLMCRKCLISTKKILLTSHLVVVHSTQKNASVMNSLISIIWAVQQSKHVCDTKEYLDVEVQEFIAGYNKHHLIMPCIGAERRYGGEGCEYASCQCSCFAWWPSPTDQLSVGRFMWNHTETLSWVDISVVFLRNW